jgi:hypothetical protein
MSSSGAPRHLLPIREEGRGVAVGTKAQAGERCRPLDQRGVTSPLLSPSLSRQRAYIYPLPLSHPGEGFPTFVFTAGK